MKSMHYRLFLLLCLPLLAFGQAEATYQTDFTPAEFKTRWQKIFTKIGGESVAVLQGVPLTNGFSMPRQSNEFYYLCGIETPHSPPSLANSHCTFSAVGSMVATT